jgi:menaquinone-dependent protoporphyrinogen oxidase
MAFGPGHPRRLLGYSSRLVRQSKQNELEWQLPKCAAKENDMDKQVLVAYATKYGATSEIAEKIGQMLRQEGLTTDVLPADRVNGLASYWAVVLGSAVYIGRWRKEAVKFLENNEAALAGRPVWLFSSGPTGEGDPVELLNGWRLPGKLQPIADRIEKAEFHPEMDAQERQSPCRRLPGLGCHHVLGHVYRR